MVGGLGLLLWRTVFRTIFRDPYFLLPGVCRFLLRSCFAQLRVTRVAPECRCLKPPKAHHGDGDIHHRPAPNPRWWISRLAMLIPRGGSNQRRDAIQRAKQKLRRAPAQRAPEATLRMQAADRMPSETPVPKKHREGQTRGREGIQTEGSRSSGSDWLPADEDDEEEDSDDTLSSGPPPLKIQESRAPLHRLQINLRSSSPTASENIALSTGSSGVPQAQVEHNVRPA